ncbi:hypothetical protein H4F99_13825 [Lysobacter sp. SG-8]|uniref:Uncharacterized protein n=1 Tax=Marilutibacter penaei TaxID=2759900 RepID=A0A7W3U5Z1_9GAMM|nr:hypothetical protein [Lysobacter penaei]MBB1089558.1 hypothetical protein [Lysobacter penaei]
MNARFRVFVLMLSTLGLAACASAPVERTAQAPERAPTIMDTDEAYVAYVERIARRRGLEVHWVNLPRAQVKPEE